MTCDITVKISLSYRPHIRRKSNDDVTNNEQRTHIRTNKLYMQQQMKWDGYEVNGRQHHLSMIWNTQSSGCGGSSEATGGMGNSDGRCLWNASAAAAAPSSFSICFASSIVLDLTLNTCRKDEECYDINWALIGWATILKLQPFSNNATRIA